MDAAGQQRADPTLALATLEQLLAIDAMTVEAAMSEVAQRIAELSGADKVDAFMLETKTHTLVAVGTSDTPLGRMQRSLGLDRLPLANGGRYVEIFTSREPFLDGRSDLDPLELPGIVNGLGVRSTIAVPLVIEGACRGVLCVTSTQPNFFDDSDLRFMQTVANWVAVIAHRAELVEQVTAEAEERGRQVAAQELVTVLAHDLRNFLTPLKMRIDLMRRKASSEEREDDARDLREASATIERLSQMIAELLDAGRLEEGAFASNPVEVDLVHLAHKVAEAQQIHSVPIDVDAPEVVHAHVDPDRIQQAVENLVSNAMRFAPGGTSVRIVVRSVFEDGREWSAITVADDGPGVAPELQARLFSRFVSGPGSSGLGLGLYVASRIAQSHGGTLTLDSIPGQGARFTLRIPCTPDEDDVTA
jgi:two-component system, OmpR family, sensor kinase